MDRASFVWVLVGASGFLWCAIAGQTSTPPRCVDVKDGADVRVRIKILEHSKPDAGTALLLGMRTGARWRHCKGRVRVYGLNTPYERDAILDARGVFVGLPPRRSSGLISPSLWRPGEVGTLSISGAPRRVVATEARDAPSLDHDRWRRGVSTALQSLMASVVLGNRDGISWRERIRWSRSGVSHLWAISGLHLGLIAWLLALGVRGVVLLLPSVGAGRPHGWLVSGVVGLIVFQYLELVGWPASGVRAGVMLVALEVCRATGVRLSLLGALGLGVSFLVLFEPHYLAQPAMWLSALCIIAIQLTAWATPSAWARFFILPVFLSASTAPLCVLLFGRVSLVGPICNLVAVPLATCWVLPATFLHFAASALGIGLLGPLATAGWKLLVAWVHLCASVSWASWSWAPTSWESLLLFSVGTSALPVSCVLRKAWILPFSVGLIALATRQTSEDGLLRVTMPSIRYGEAILLELPAGKTLLVDGGGTMSETSSPGGAVDALLAQRGNRALDAALITHADPDHLGGLSQVFLERTVRELWWSGRNAKRLHASGILRAQPDLEVHTVAHMPQRFVWGGATFSILHPRSPTELYFPELDANENSVVFKLSLGDCSILLTGDIEFWGEYLLLQSRQDLRAQVLKVAHHGSETSSSMSFLDGVGPRVALIGAGHRNPFDFPRPTVVNRLKERGTEVWVVGEVGEIELTTDGRAWSVRGHNGRETIIACRPDTL